MNRILPIVLIIFIFAGCGRKRSSVKRVEVASVGNTILYLDQMPGLYPAGTSKTDSAAASQNYINKWVRKELLFQKAQDNLSPEFSEDIKKQLEEARSNLVIYQYQRQMMLERMDTVVSDSELVNYYNANPASFNLSSNIVKALFIKLPVETPNIEKIKHLARSNGQSDLQDLEKICYQFAEKFDDFNEEWIPFDRISVELPSEIDNEENFLRRTSFYELSDSSSIYLVNFRDYKIRFTLAPFEYVKDDIKRIIWNNRRIEFFQNLENGIYNDALKDNKFKIF
jgi:HEPN domain-containing protein